MTAAADWWTRFMRTGYTLRAQGYAPAIIHGTSVKMPGHEPLFRVHPQTNDNNEADRRPHAPTE